MKRKISVSLLALVLGVPAVALLSGAVSLFHESESDREMRRELGVSGAVSLFHESESIVRLPEERRAIAKKLYGDIKIVTAGADYEVRVVDAGADLRVKVVDAGALYPGRWRFVDAGEDYRVKFVDAGADIEVQFVNAGEGL